MSFVNKLTHLQRIQRVHIWMMSSPQWAWLAPVCMIGKVVVEPNPMGTAGTDGVDVFYDPKFIEACNEKQLRFVVIHENMHKALLHLVIHKALVQSYVPMFGLKQARMLVNIAQDFVINREIMKHAGDKVEMPDIKGAHDAKYDDDSVWDTSRIAEDIAKNAKGGGGKGGKGQKGQQGDQPGEGNPFGDTFDDHDWESAPGKAEDGKTAAEAEALAQAHKDAVADALRQGQALSRKINGNMPRSVEGLLEPTVDWRDALRNFLLERVKGKDMATYKRPNRRFMSSGLYMPTTYSESLDVVSVCVDTSGSIGPAELQEVMSELKGLFETIKPAEVHMIYWDTHVAAFECYEGDAVSSIIDTTKPAGGGGTQPSCVPAYYARKDLKKPTVAIWMSDGFVGGDWGEGLGVPAFWVIASNGSVPSHLPHIQLPKR